MWPGASDTSDTARFDYAVLLHDQQARADALHAANPGMAVFMRSSACELPLDPSQPADSWTNREIAAVPNAWIQTQVGSTLTSSVSATATVLKVITSTRFRVGDILVLGDELAKVTSVSTGALRVTRGVLSGRSPAAYHPKGTRVAAAVVFWPGSVVMDLSGYCVPAVVDAAIGPETWARYNARKIYDQYRGGNWDGVFVDRTNADAYINKVFTRSIDPRRNNTYVTDGYVALNKSWNIGLTRFEYDLRQRLGTAVLLGNNAYPNHSLLSGTTLEGFPRVGSFSPFHWTWVMFGTNGRSYSNEAASYSAFSRNSRQPNFTSLLTYEEEKSPTAGLPVFNPTDDPDWVPNYRKMRFGLTSTLMADGFFSYEIGTFGSGGTPGLWFDEYDNAGKGRGYLGRPTGAAYRASAPLLSRDLLRGDGAFSSLTRLGRWKQFEQRGYAVGTSLSDGAAKLVVTQSRGSAYGATVYRKAVPIAKGATYTLSFKARSNTPRAIQVYVEQASSPFAVRLPYGRFILGTSWRTYAIPMVSRGSDSAARIVLAVGEKIGTVYIDDIKLQAGVRQNIWRRNFTNGTAIVNADTRASSLSLGATYRKLVGTQDRVVNNGAYISRVWLGGLDGVVLLRTSPLSISAARTISAGTTTTITGSLRSTGGLTLAGRRVTLFRSAGSTGWIRSSQTTTAIDGSFSFPVRPSQTTRYIARFYSDGDNLDGFSKPTTVYVRAVVSTPTAPLVMRVGRYRTIYGTLSPHHAAGSRPVRIYLYRRVSGYWKSYGYVTASASDLSSGLTRYSAAIRLSRSGSWRLRARHEDAGHVAAWSRAYAYVTAK